MRTAAYARYSTELQSDASLEDQLRNVRACCDRHGWPHPVAYSDAALSGSRSDRPGFRSLLADAAAGRFDVLLLDDLSRLSRDKDECGKIMKRLAFTGVRVIAVSDGIDTVNKGHKVNAGLRGLMAELYVDDLAEKVHRGLTGRALAGASAGGLSYGYRVAGVGQRAIDEAQATIVRRIFAEYCAGRSPRVIATGLNAEGIPSPSGAKWSFSAIYSDHVRSIGILANPIYIGRQVWNRSRWVKHPDTGRRLRKERPESEWIVREHPELAIVDRAVWDAAQARIRRQRAPAGPDRLPGAGAGRPARYLLSGILRCGSCGGPMVAINQASYGCSRFKNGSTSCADMRVNRSLVEDALLSGIKSRLLTDSRWRLCERHIAAALKSQGPDLAAARARVTAAERVHGHIIAALRAGIITPSTRAELLAAEAEVTAAREALAQAQQHEPATIIPRARDEWRKLVEGFSELRGVPELRAWLVAEIGQSIVLRKEGGAVYAEIGASNLKMVAGACYGLYLTEPVRIPIPRKPSRE